jgi:spermine oxidase
MHQIQLTSLLVVLFPTINCHMADTKNDVQILIIGAGAAGVSALSRLLESGYRNVTLLEAQDYMGGRVRTVPFGANVVDLGGQWVHGEEDNVVFEMVRKYNVLDRTPYSWLGIGGICKF